MAKCPRCESRKGKRFCPALDSQICAQCCANERLATIECPRDCPHLKGEFFQHGRRRKRAMSEGKAFLEDLKARFLQDARRQLAFLLLADVFWWTRQHGAVDDEALAAALDEVNERESPVWVETSSASPLAGFLHELIQKSPPESQRISTHLSNPTKNEPPSPTRWPR